ncbi:MAG: carboxymuconolactone decarboxylase family protein [Planctomycetota bacterium]
MPRLQPVRSSTANAKAAHLLENVKKKLGSVPNLISTMANSPAAAQAYLDFNQALAGGELPPRLREQIALAVGQNNECDYCVAAHSFLGKRTGLTDEQVIDARRGSAADERTAAALSFAHKLVEHRGWVSNEDVDDVRHAGYSDGEIAEIVAHVALNIFTNYFNHVAGTEIDFPAAPALASA